MIIKVTDDIYLSPYEESDVDQLVSLLEDITISENTFIPFPYLTSDALDWIRYTISEAEVNKVALNYAIRKRGTGLIGGIGLKKSANHFEKHKAEVGYWLGKPYRNQSIVSNSLKVFSDWALKRLGFIKLYAPILKRNIASQMAAEKAGYVLEAELKKHYLKEDQYLDGVIYSYFNSAF